MSLISLKCGPSFLMASKTLRFAIVIAAITVITTLLPIVHQDTKNIARADLHQSHKNLSCISGPGRDNREGLGAFIRRNQIAFFLAASNDVPISFKTAQSHHGYRVSDFFGKCEGKVEPGCSFSETQMLINRCPRADCECLRKDMDRLFGNAEKKCKRIHINSVNLFHTEYSGCIRPALSKYFGNDTRPPFEYDAVHFRQGDLKGANNSLAWSEENLYRIITAMCRLSNRPIVIITQGKPKIPVCGHKLDRRILANDLSLHESFRIMQHARHVSVGRSSFAIAMMELANPERVVVLDHAAKEYAWVNCEKWTVCGNGIVLYNFNSKDLMIKAVLHDKNLHPRTFPVAGARVFPPKFYHANVPTRMWVNEGM